MNFRIAAPAALVAVLAASYAAAQQPSDLPQADRSPAASPHDTAGVYQPAGAPADPLVPAQWNRYHSYTEATRLLRALANAHPERARLRSLGRTYGGREMWLLTITSFDRGPEAERPAFWIDGGIHANEIQSVEVVLYTAWYLLEMYGRSPFVTRLLDERVFYLLPMMSPDSRDAHMHEPNTTHSPRSGQRPVDDDRDGLVDEDPPDDLDGDGHIVSMRMRDPRGKWKPHPDYPQLMVRVRPDETGSYRLLGTEGYDNDGDGEVNEDGDGYYDPNRNWAWNWQPAYVQEGAHHYPFSIEENRLVAEFVLSHPHIAGAQSYHNAAGMILRGPGVLSDAYEPADVAVFDQIGRRGEQMLPGYRYLDVARGLYEAYGAELDWFYAMRGVFQFTNELNTGFNLFRRESEGYFGREEDLHAFDRYLLLGDGLVPWHEVDHPQYGKVEVGGYKKDWVRQPPSFLLEEECHRNMAFTLYHADQLPRVEIEGVQVRPVAGAGEEAAPAAGGLYEITAVLVNTRLTPTRAAVAVKRRLTPPDTAEIDGSALKVLAGMNADNPFFDRAVEQERQPAALRIESIPGMGSVYVRWLVGGTGRGAITYRGVQGGAARAAFELP
jgi:hypothetical protein